MRIRYALILLTGFSSCSNSKEEKPVAPGAYFDLPTYFRNEAKRLETQSPKIVKTVSLNDQTEQKSITIKDWKRELSVFIEADINKASWRGAFATKITDTSTIYSTNNEKIAVKRLEIGKRSGHISSIKITLKNDNDLYTAQDELLYFPDSLYKVRKVQKVRLMDKKTFEVVGKF